MFFFSFTNYVMLTWKYVLRLNKTFKKNFKKWKTKINGKSDGLTDIFLIRCTSCRGCRWFRKLHWLSTCYWGCRWLSHSNQNTFSISTVISQSSEESFNYSSGNTCTTFLMILISGVMHHYEIYFT